MIDVTTIQELLVASAFLVPVTVAIVQVFKSTFSFVPSDFIPMVSTVAGVLLGMFVLGFTPSGGFAGLIIGLTASGFYDLGRPVVRKVLE